MKNLFLLLANTKRSNKTWFYILCLMIGITLNEGLFSQTTYTATVTQDSLNPWKCGNENLSPSKYNFISGQNGTFRSALLPNPATWVIPVVVHVLYDAAHANDPAHNLTYKQIQWQISELNTGFQKYFGSTMPRATNTGIQFCLAQTPMGPSWTNAAEPGIMRYQVATSVISHTMDAAGQNGLYNTTHSVTGNFPYENYLNVWLVDEIIDTTGVAHGGTPNTGVMGYSNFPNTPGILDGIVIRNSIFGSNWIPNNQNILIPSLDKGSIMVHEAGHYLNLLHTFQDGCAGTNSTTCLSQGDLICDTPPSNVTNIACTYTNTCVDNLPVYSGFDQPDFLHNFMCYADDDCLDAFTADQSAIMQGVLSTAWPIGRQDMTSATNLAATGLSGAFGCCPTGVTTAYFKTAVTSCSAMTFSVPIPPCAMNNIYQWDFGDGTTYTATTTNTVTHTYSLAGRYTASLTVIGSNSTTAAWYKIIEIGSYAKASSKVVCNNSYQGVNFHVQTTGPGTYTMTTNFNGSVTTNTFNIVFAEQDRLGHHDYTNIEKHIQVALSPTVTLPATIVYTVSLASSSICSVTYVDTFTVINCCNNLITNGDFNSGYVGFSYPNGGVVNNGAGWLRWPFKPSLNFDSPLGCLSAPATCTSLVMYNAPFALVAGNQYRLNYLCMGGQPGYLAFNTRLLLIDTLFLNPIITDNSGNIIHDFGNVPIMDLTDSTWNHFDYGFSNPSFTGTGHFVLKQVKNFYSKEAVALVGTGMVGWGYDYSIDEVNVRAVSNPYSVTITPGSTVLCTPSTRTLTASAGSTYTWSTGASTNSIVVTPTVTTQYSVTATSSLNCVAGTQSTITIAGNPTVSISPATPSICAGSSVTLTASGAATYLWSNGTSTSSIVVSPTITTSYTVIGTSALGGCTGTKVVTVVVSSIPAVGITPASTTVCAGSPVTLKAVGAATYLWSTGSSSPTILVSPMVTTVYTLTGTTSGCSASATATVSVIQNPTLTLTASATTICVGQSSTLTVGGASTYSWSTGATTTTVAVSPTVTTTYSATGTSSVGCSTTKTITVTVVPNVPVINASNLTMNTCSTTASTLTASGAATYTWMPGSVTSNTAVVTPTALTVYTVSGQYAMTGCGIGSTTLVVNPNTSTLCCSSASITIGTSLTSTVNMAAGNYTVSGTVIDMRGTITFTGNTSFNGYTLRMAPNTKLVVQSDYSLTLTNSKLFSCSELWDGIYLSENNTKIGNITITNSTIEDMYNGIVMDCNNATIPTGSVTLGHISIDQSMLNKNYTGIQLKNANGVGAGTSYNLALTSATISSNASSTSPGSTLKPSNTYTYAYTQITNGTLGNSAPYLSFPRTFMGIYLSRLGANSAVKIGDNSSSAYTNTFDNMDFGIYGKDVQLAVQNNYFKNITGSYKSEDIDHGGGYRAIGPEEIGVGVLVAHGMGDTYTLTVGTGTVVSTSNPYPKGNVFEDCNKGVKSDNAATTYVSGNIFTSASTDIPVISTTGSPPILISNPNTYYYYKAQNAAWYTGFEGTARFYYNYVRNQAVGAYASVSTGTAVQIAIEGNDIAAPSATGYCKNAVQLSQTAGTLLNASVITNTIANVYNGVTAGSLLSGLQINGNTISVETTAKTYNYNAASRRTGITLNYCQYANVQGNSISGNGSVPTSTTTAQYLNGVYLTNSKLGKVECNTTTALGRDFVFEGICNNRWLVNDMSNSYIGLEIRNNGVIDNQGAPTYTGTPNLSANTWTNITRHTSIISSANVNTNSKLFLLAGGNTEPTLNFATIPAQTYTTGFGNGIQPTTGTSYTCLGGYSAQRMANSSSRGNNRVTESKDSLVLYTLLATNEADDYEVFPDEFVYQGKQMVYKLVKQDSIEPIDSSALDNFYEANLNSGIDHLTQVQELLAANNITDAISKNASVVTANTVEQKHQRANELALKYLNDRSYNYTANERQDLISLANECLVKGYYVVQSRNILSLISNQVMIYDDNCDTKANNSRKAQATNKMPATSFVLFPNPNSGTMQLDYDLGNDNTAIMKLFDVTGKLIRSYRLYGTKGSLQMNEQNLGNGIYFYRILVGDKITKNDKIIIIK